MLSFSTGPFAFRCAVLHRRGTPEQQESIRRHGYRLVEFEGWNFNDVLTALTIYKNYYGSLDVPEDYKLKEPALKPGSRIYNMPLGVFVKRFQDGDVDGIDDPYRKQKLEAIGFKWKNPKEMLRFRWYPFIIGLMVHLQIEEDVDVEPNYVIPDNDLFPVWIRGLQLGKMVQMCRQQQNLLFKKFPDRAALLDDYDFKWWIPPVETTGFGAFVLPSNPRLSTAHVLTIGVVGAACAQMKCFPTAHDSTRSSRSRCRQKNMLASKQTARSWKECQWRCGSSGSTRCRTAASSSRSRPNRRRRNVRCRCTDGTEEEESTKARENPR
jgi:hypothetical protein